MANDTSSEVNLASPPAEDRCCGIGAYLGDRYCAQIHQRRSCGGGGSHGKGQS